jgi:gliding motility-associated-like protein
VYRLFCLVSLAWVCCTGLRAQTFFKRLGSPGVDEGGNALVASPDGYFFVGGYRADSALVMKVDGLGQVLWSKCFKPEPLYTDLVQQLAITADGYLIGAGNGVGGSPAITRRCFYFKCDLNGNFQWIRTSNDVRTVYTRGMLPTSNGEYTLVNDIYDTNAPTHPDVDIQRISAVSGAVNGNTTLDYIPNVSYIDDIAAGVLGHGGSMYTTGRVYVNGAPQTMMRPYISKFGPGGTHLWSTHYIGGTNASARIYGNDVCFSADSLTLGYTGDLSGASSQWTTGLIHTDPTGNMAWGRDYNVSDFSTENLFSVVPMPYGYAVVGVGTDGDLDLFAYAVSRSGELLWARRFGTPGTAQDLLNQTTRNAIAVGSDLFFTARTQVNGGRDILLIRLDEHGEVACLPPTDLTMAVTVLPLYDNELSPALRVDNIPFVTAGPVSPSFTTDACLTTASFMGPDLSVCDPVVLHAAASGANSYEWQDGSTDDSFMASGPGTYWVRATIDCCIVTDTAVISGSPPEADFSYELRSCGDTVIVTDHSIDATSVHWDLGNGQTSDLPTANAVFDTPGIAIISLIASNACGSDTASGAIVIGWTTGSVAITGPEALCANSTGSYSAEFTNVQPVDIHWSTGDEGISTLFAPLVSSELTIEVLGDDGCTHADTLPITLLPAPLADMSYAQEPCNSTIQFTDASAGALAWDWRFADVATADVSDPAITFPGPGTYAVQLIVTGSCGTDTLTSAVTIGATGTITPAMPNVFSPNGDGVNDRFLPINAHALGSMDLAVFDRWGLEIFRSTSTAGWNGTHAGDPVPAGTYFYLVRWVSCAGTSEEHKGSVTLLR